jgi:hypothetical protein
MNPLDLTPDVKLGVVAPMLENRVHRITFPIMASALGSSLMSWTSEGLCGCQNVAIQWATKKTIPVIVATCG